jgi:hypothetical protein
MADIPAPRSAADAFNEASPSGGADFPLSEDAQARALAQHAADAAGPLKPPVKQPILSTTYPAGPGAPGIPWSNPYDEFPGGAEALAGAITGNASVQHPEVGALTAPRLGLGVTDPRAWKIAGNMMVSRDPAGQERQIKSLIPEATWTGEGSERMVQVPGHAPVYLDRPGVTPAKGLFYGPQTLAAVMSGGRSLPAQMGLGGAQHALSNAASYLLGGATSAIDPLGTAIATLAPGVLGAAGAGLIKGYDYLNSEVVPPAADVIKKLGVQGYDAATQAAANIADRAKTLYKFGFAGKPGDLTRDPVLLAKEDMAFNAGSDPAKKIMGDFHEANAAATLEQKRLLIGQNAGDIAPDIKKPPADYFPNEATFGNRVNNAVTDRYKSLTAAERDAWERTGDISPTNEAGRAVMFPREVSQDLSARVSKTLADSPLGLPDRPDGTYSPELMRAGGQQVLDAFNTIKARTMTPATGDAGAASREFNLGELQQTRRQLEFMANTAPNSDVARVIRSMKGEVDAAVASAEDNGKLIGDPTALTNFRAANATTRAKYDFTNPKDNPAAASFIDKVLNPAVPATGQETVSTILGGGTVTPGGGTNAILTHLQAHLGDEATKPLAGATTMRSLYGTKGTTEEGGAAPMRYDYDSTANRIHSQIAGAGDEVSANLLSPESRARLGDFRDALNILGASNRKGGPRLNAPGSGYIGMMTRQIPFGLGPYVDKMASTQVAKNAVQGGADIVNAAVGGATTPAGLGIRLPHQSTIQGPDPQNPFYSWQPGAWRAGTPVYRGGGLLGSEALDPNNRGRITSE